MDWREFIASLVDSLAWPGAVVLLVVLLRGHIAELLGGPLRRLKLGPGGAEFEWDRALVEVTAKSVRALPTSTEVDELDEELDHLEEMAKQAPGEALRQAFVLVMRQLSLAIEAGNLERPADDNRPNALIKAAFHGGVINKQTGDALRGLVTLYDLAARDLAAVTEEKAADYLILVRAVLYALRMRKT